MIISNYASCEKMVVGIQAMQSKINHIDQKTAPNLGSGY
jgi:hypothetical protein